MSTKDNTLKIILNNLNLFNKNVLDLGPGSGRWLDYIKKFNPNQIYAADFSLKIKAKCKEKVDEFKIINFENGKIDFKSNSMDIIMIIEVLEHIRNYKPFLKELIRISKSGGVLIFTIPNICSFISRVRLLFGLLPVAIASDDTHVNFFRKKEILKVFKLLKQNVKFYSSSFSINLFNPKSKFRFKSFSFLSMIDDSYIFVVKVQK